MAPKKRIARRSASLTGPKSTGSGGHPCLRTRDAPTRLVASKHLKGVEQWEAAAAAHGGHPYGRLRLAQLLAHRLGDGQGHCLNTLVRPFAGGIRRQRGV